jgi:xanthine dehydrogenase accessory factor
MRFDKNNSMNSINTMKSLSEITIAIKGAGEMASAIAWRLYMANLRRIFMMEDSHPLAVRRRVSFCEAIHEGRQTVESVTAVAVAHPDHVHTAWEKGWIAVLNDPQWKALHDLTPDVCVDAILAKKNLGTTMTDANTVIGIGPGFFAGKDVHMVVESNRGHHLGRIIIDGSAEPNTGIPGEIGGYTKARVLRSPADGCFEAGAAIGDLVKEGAVIGHVGKAMVRSQIDGVIRGLIRTGTQVKTGWKLGDIDPRGNIDHCATISDKARAVSGSVLEAILRVYLAPAEKKS